MDTIGGRLITWLMRSIATAMLFAGASILVAGVPLFALLDDSPAPRTIAGIVMQIGGLFVVAGIAAAWLSRTRRPVLPNERLTTPEAGRPPVGGWLVALAIALVALPAWLVIRLQPFLAEWNRVARFIASWDIWEGANANMSGVVLVPVAAALTPPFFELAALVGFVAGSALLLLLLLLRSRRFPRAYFVSTILLAALVLASVRGSDAARLAADEIHRLIDTTSPTSDESDEMKNGLNRYTSIVSSTAPVLVWTLFGYLIWIPPLLSSRRAAMTFANPVEHPVAAPVKATDVAAITSPPRFPM
jgi:hypothetical protein